ncbi:hypothetical protein MRB53_042156 [Persea americana]|nr:hypothetical protein MRB53_042156 [Persea americana]
MRYHVHSELEANAIRPKIGDWVRLWDHEFQWTSSHQLPQELAPLRHACDDLADQCLQELEIKLGVDAYEHLREKVTGLDKEKYPRSLEFWKQLHTLPEFVDFEQIRRGQDVFFRYIGAALTGLLNDSLLGGFGARRISEVLVRTGSFGKASARRRLLQTTQWILEVMDSPEALQFGAKGFKSTIQVRLLHAQVRRPNVEAL